MTAEYPELVRLQVRNILLSSSVIYKFLWKKSFQQHFLDFVTLKNVQSVIH